jgi:hypothetical protein
LQIYGDALFKEAAMLSKPYRSLLILMFSLIPEFALAGMFDLPSMVTQKAIQNLSEVTKPPTD